MYQKNRESTTCFPVLIYHQNTVSVVHETLKLIFCKEIICYSFLCWKCSEKSDKTTLFGTKI